MVVQRQFFALDMNDANSRVTFACHTCASLLSFPPSLVSQSSDDPPEVVRASFAADVIKRHHQSILALRECTTSFTASCLTQDEKHDTLRDALTRLIIGLHPLDGPRAIVRVDFALGFASISNNNSLNILACPLLLQLCSLVLGSPFHDIFPETDIQLVRFHLCSFYFMIHISITHVILAR